MKCLVGWMALAMLAGAADADQILRLDPASQARAGIVTRPVLERTFGKSFRVVGQVVRKPGSTSTVKSVLEGRVDDLMVAPGDTVAEGQVLMELHSHALYGMQGELLNEFEQFRLAENRLEAGKKLFDLDGISQLDVQQREQQLLTARLGFELARSELLDLGFSEEVLQTILEQGSADSHLPIKAPFAGVVLELGVQRHEWVQAFDPLVVLGNPDQLELQLQIPADQASTASRGDVVEFVPVGRPDSVGRARVISRVPQVDPRTRTVTVRAEIYDGREVLFPGVFVEGQLVQGEPDPLLRSPSPRSPDSARRTMSS